MWACVIRGGCCVGLLLQAAGVFAQSAGERALLDGRAAEAEQMLRDAIARNHDPADHLLLCRTLYAEDHFDEALPECESATDSPSPTSDAFLWLGRVEGARASHANALLAFALARKVRAAFLRAVELDPNNDAAIGDLGEYFVEAPAIVGGGVEQARTLAAGAMARQPSAAHRVLGMVDRHTDEAAGAEQEFRAAVSTARRDELPGAWIDLAHLLQHQGRNAEAVAAVHSAVASDTRRGPALVDAARLLTHLGQPPAAAIDLLREYLASANRSDAAPAFKVHDQLAALLDRTGDVAGAGRERAIAHSLAPTYVLHHPSGRSDAIGDSEGQVR